MIDEKEIRIGNWLTHNHEWNYSEFTGDFQWECSDWYALGESTLHLENVSPIPLTDEWLLKFGGDIKPYSIGIILDRFRFIWKESYNYWYVLDKDSQSYMTKIEWVHECQNFFKALNGQELQVKS